MVILRALLFASLSWTFVGVPCWAQPQPDFTPQDLIADAGQTVIEIADPDQSRPLVEIRQCIAVRGIVPSRRLRQARGPVPEGLEARPDIADIRDFQLERREQLAGGKYSEWKRVDVAVAKEMLSRCSGFQVGPDDVAENMTDPVISMPLPARLTGEWNRMVSHPRLHPDVDADQPGTGILLRYLDFDVVAGLTYQYRVAIVVKDFAESKRTGTDATLTSRFSEPTPDTRVQIPWHRDPAEVGWVREVVDARQRNATQVGDFHSRAIISQIRKPGSSNAESAGELPFTGPSMQSQTGGTSIETWVDVERNFFRSQQLMVRTATDSEGKVYTVRVKIVDFLSRDDRETRYLLEPVSPQTVGRQIVIRAAGGLGQKSWKPHIDPQFPMHPFAGDVLQRILSQTETPPQTGDDQSHIGKHITVLVARQFHESREAGKHVVWVSYIEGIAEKSGLRVHSHVVMRLHEALSWNCVSLDRRLFFAGKNGGDEVEDQVTLAYRRFANGWICEGATNGALAWKLDSIEPWDSQQSDHKIEPGGLREGDLLFDQSQKKSYEWRDMDWKLANPLQDGSSGTPYLRVAPLANGVSAFTFEWQSTTDRQGRAPAPQ